MNRKQLPMSVKLSVTKKVIDGEWSIEEAAEAVGFSRQSVARWVAMLPSAVAVDADAAPVVSPEPIPVPVLGVAEEGGEWLEESVRKTLDDVMLRRPHLRKRSLQEYVRRHHGLHVPRRVVARYLRERGLCGAAASMAGNVGSRRFESASPMELIQVDVMYIRRDGGGYFYGLSVLDDHSRMALGMPVLEAQTAEEVLRAFRLVIEKWRPPARVLTDRGPQFVSWRGRTAFQDYVEDELWATHIVAAAHHPQTLGKVERFHLTLRREALTRPEYDTREEVQRVLDHYLAWYNYARPHQSLALLTPAERFYGMRRPIAETVGPHGWRSDKGVYVAMNLAGRRLIIAGEGPECMQVIWDEDRALLPPRAPAEDNRD